MNDGICEWCGLPLPSWERADRRTCSDRCRKRASLARKNADVAARQAPSGADHPPLATTTAERGNAPCRASQP